MRLKDLQKEMRKKKIGLTLFFSIDADNVDPNLVYFSQYTGFGALVVTQNKAVLVVPKAEHVRAKKTSKIKVVVAEKRLFPIIKKSISGRPKRIGIDKNRISLNFYSAIRKEFKGRYVDIAPVCLRLRTVKTSHEVRIINKSCAIADEIMQKTFWNFKKFKTEAEVSAFMKNEVNIRGLSLAFPPIVASGSNACEPHHEPDTQKIKKGFCVIDFGVKYKGYCSDITRTIYLGTPSKKEIEQYYQVLRVQEELISLCSVGRSFPWIDKKARELFGADAQYFTHLIGHGVGTEIHESPNPKVTARRPVTKLLENSVITIEPGLYYPHKSGIRIEDDILIRSIGPKQLTKTGKNLLIIKRE